MPEIDLVIFDMDGIVFEGRNFWLDLHRALGTEADAWRLWHAYGRTDYRRLAAATVAQVWRGRDARPLLELAATSTASPISSDGSKPAASAPRSSAAGRFNSRRAPNAS